MEIGSSSSSSCNQQEDRIIEPGLTHVKIYKTSNEKKIAPKVFGFQTRDLKEEPIIDPKIEDEGELPPYVIVVHGPPKVGKSLLIKCLVEYYNSNGGHGREVIVLANQRRIQFVECPNNINGMIDAAKYADAVIFLIDTRYGFEMETFEFLNILQVNGIVKVMGVLTYLDGIKNDEILTKTKERLIDHFHSEIYEAATIFSLPFGENKMYSTEEIRNLASFLSDMHFHHLSWRATQPYVLIRDFKDVTLEDKVQKDVKCNRDIVLDGYLRGCNNIKKGTMVHIAGVGDFPLFRVTIRNDPFPLPGKERFNIKGLRIGTYVSLEIRGVPSEMVENENPCCPILVGGIEEEKAGYMQATLMRHSWHSKLLKSRDPIIVSIGWRRYQTHPIYALECCQGLLQMLSCTPKDKQCIAVFWGPLAPPSTGVVVVQSTADHEAPFRILATGIVHGNNQAKVFQKRSLVGTFGKSIKKVGYAADKELVDHLKMKNNRLRGGIAKCKSVKVPRPIYKAGLTLWKPFKVLRPTNKAGLTSLKPVKVPRPINKGGLTSWKPVKVPRIFYPLLTALKPRDRIWKYFGPADGMTEPSEAVKKYYEDMRDKNAPAQTEEEMDAIVKRLQEKYDEEDDDCGVGRRETREQQRAVLIVEGKPRAQTSLYGLGDLQMVHLLHL